jgi:hypothetical protein
MYERMCNSFFKKNYFSLFFFFLVLYALSFPFFHWLLKKNFISVRETRMSECNEDEEVGSCVHQSIPALNFY